jgi:biotin-[acetyl-CoA-carboxylase] ligase BirA-like protein
MEEIRLYNTIDSTNVEAQRLLTNPSIIAHGTTLLAWEQTHGKGQLGRPWHTEPGQHLAMTIILKPDATARELPRLSKLISLAICTVLENLNPDFRPAIKWPNDIYLDGKKVAGILIENALAGNRIQHLIAGIGMNVNETAFAPELSNATSLHIISGKEFDILEIAKSIQEKIISLIEKGPRGSTGHRGTDFSNLHASSMQSEKFEGQNSEGQTLENEYSSRLFMKNKTAEFDQQGKLVHGEIMDVDDQGRLVLRIDEQPKSYYTHEIKWII